MPVGSGAKFAYWKLHDGRQDMLNQPAGMLVVLSVMPKPSGEGIFRLPSQLQYAVGHSFTDVLHPERKASVAADENGTYLLLRDLDHVGIFAPSESLRQDGAQSWMVSLACNGYT